MITFIVYIIVILVNCVMWYYAGKSQGKYEILEKMGEEKRSKKMKDETRYWSICKPWRKDATRVCLCYTEAGRIYEVAKFTSAKSAVMFAKDFDFPIDTATDKYIHDLALKEEQK